MSETAILDQSNVQVPQVQEPVQQVAPEPSQIMAESLWNLNPTAYQNIDPAQAQEQSTQEVAPPAAEAPPQDDIIDLDVYFQREFGMNPDDFKTKWDEFNKPKDPVTPPEQKWVYDDSKEEEIYTYINQKRQLERLEQYDVADANQAAEIIRANLQFKYKDLKPQEIDRLFTRQYSMPSKPEQTLEQSDDDYAASVERWQQQIQEKQQDMIIDAKLAKPELSQYRSQIVRPEIQQPKVQQAGPTPEELAAMEAGRKAYLGAVESGYQNFKGFTVTAKDGEVQLPISYNISQEELVASKQSLQDLNVTDFFGKRWFDESGNPNVTLIQEDLYSLANRDKIHQKIANETAAQMKALFIKSQNNIKLNGVNSELGPLPPAQAPKNESQMLAERIWGM